MRRFVLLTAGSVLLALALAACNSLPGSYGDGDSGQQSAAPANASVVKLSESSFGPILTDGSGRTLYAFTRDERGPSTCEGECIATWPALKAQGAPAAGDGVDGSLLGTVKRSDGTSQITYQSWPLYFYGGDLTPGEVNGQGVKDVWFVVGADGKLVRQAAPAGDSSTGGTESESSSSQNSLGGSREQSGEQSGGYSSGGSDEGYSY